MFRLNKLIKQFLKIWVIGFEIFLLITSIIGYNHFQNELVKMSVKISAHEMIYFFTIISFPIFICCFLFLWKSSGINLKKITLLLIFAPYNTIGIIGFYLSADLYPKLIIFLNIFSIIFFFLIGIRLLFPILSFIKDVLKN